MSPKYAAEGPSFSIVIPFFNEQENIPPLLKTIFKEIGDHPAFHITNSTDAALKLLHWGEDHA